MSIALEKLRAEKKHLSAGTLPVLSLSYVGLLLLIGLGGGLVLKFRLYHFFQTILILYIGVFVTLPLLYGTLATWRLIFCQGHVRSSIRCDSTICYGISLALLSTFVYASLIEPQSVQVEHVRIYSDALEREVKILHITDIQSAWIGRYERKVFELIASLEPDIILHTGDMLQPYFFKERENEEQKLAQLFRQLHPRYGIYNVIGDVDWRLLRDNFDRQAGITTLHGQQHMIEAAGVTLKLLGLTLEQSCAGARERIVQWQRSLSDKEFGILFGHAPDYILDVQDLDIDLSLTGHTHGGQIRIPFLGPIETLSRVPKDWAMGYRKVNKIHFNVSPGIGAEHAAQLPPIRLNCPPGMTLFTITPEG